MPPKAPAVSQSHAVSIGSMTPDQLEAEVKKQMEDGNSIGYIASALGISFDVVARICHDLRGCKKDLASATNPRQMSRDNLNIILNAIPIAEDEYKMKPNQFNGYTLTNLIQESRSLAKDMVEFEDPREKAEELVRLVLIPLMKDFFRESVVELRALRTKSLAFVIEGKEGSMDMAIKDVIRSMGSASSQIYKKSLMKVGELMGCDLEKEPITKVVPVFTEGQQQEIEQDDQEEDKFQAQA